MVVQTDEGGRNEFEENSLPLDVGLDRPNSPAEEQLVN